MVGEADGGPPRALRARVAEGHGAGRKAEGRSRKRLCLRYSAFRRAPFRLPQEETAEPLPAIDESSGRALSKAPLQRFAEGLDNLVEAEALHNVAQVLPIGQGEATSRSFRSIGIPEPIDRCWVAAV